MYAQLALLACLSLILTGCNGGPQVWLKNAPPATLEAGWKTLETKDGAVSMGIPANWRSATERSGFQEAMSSIYEQMEGNQPSQQQMDTAASGLPDSLKKMNEEMEVEEERARAAEWAEKGILLMAYDNSRPIPGEPRTSITLKKRDDGGGTIEDAVRKLKEGVPGDVQTQVLDLPIGRAGEVKAKYTTIAGDEICEIRYVLLDGEDRYTVNFITANGMQQIEPISRSVVQTLRIRPKAG